MMVLKAGAKAALAPRSRAVMPCAVLRVKAGGIGGELLDSAADRSEDSQVAAGRERMLTLEESVERLAGALDALEARLEERVSDFVAKSESVEAAKMRARTARTQAAAAAEDLADAVRSLKSLTATGG